MFRETSGVKPLVVTVALYNMSLGKSEDTECENVVVYAPNVCMGDQLNNIGFVVASARTQQRFSGRDTTDRIVSVVLADRVLMRCPIEGEYCIFIAFPLSEESITAREWDAMEHSMVTAIEAVVKVSYRCYALLYGSVQSTYDRLRLCGGDRDAVIRGLPGWDRMRQAATFFFYRTLIRPMMDEVRRTIVDHAAPFTMCRGLRIVPQSSAQHLALSSLLNQISAMHSASLWGMVLVSVSAHLVVSTIDRDDTTAVLHLVRRRLAEVPYNRDAEDNLVELERLILESKATEKDHPLRLLLELSKRPPHSEAPTFLPAQARIMGKCVAVLEVPIAPAHHLFLFVAPSYTSVVSHVIDEDIEARLTAVLSLLRSTADGGGASEISSLAYHYHNVVSRTSKSTVRSAASASDGGPLYRSDRMALRNLEVLCADATVHQQVMTLWKWSPRWSVALWKHMGRELTTVLPQHDSLTAVRQATRLPDHVFQEMFHPTL